MRAALAGEIYQPETVEQVLELLKDKGEGTHILAGGTDLVVQLKGGLLKADNIIDIVNLPLSYIKGSRSDGFRIGATTTAYQLHRSEVLQKDLPVLVKAAANLGGPQTQALATIGGNICNASPAANLSTILVALGAKVKIQNAVNEREIEISDLFVGPGKTRVEKEEILTEIIIPALPDQCGTSYIKFTTRRHMDIALLGVAVKVVPNGNKIQDIKIALAAIGPTVLLAEKAQQSLIGKEYSAEAIKSASVIAEGEGSYITDARATASYRKTVAKVIVSRAIEDAWNSLKGDNQG